MIWGGYEYDPDENAYNYSQAGGLYNPVVDDWTATSLSGAPLARGDHETFWTVTEFLIWGGVLISQDFDDVYLNSGALYDPSLDQWQEVSMAAAPEPRSEPVISWTGEQMIVWGGSVGGGENSEYLNDGAVYDVVNNLWTTMPVEAAPEGTHYPASIWTGEDLFVWGGCQFADNDCQYQDSGGLYNLQTNSWRPMSVNNRPIASSGAFAVWTGEDVIVWSGEYGNPNIGAAERLYNPETDEWRTMAEQGQPYVEFGEARTWTGKELIVWGGAFDHFFRNYQNTGARYNPLLNQWSEMSTDFVPVGRYNFSSVWTGEKMILWGGMSGNTGEVKDEFVIDSMGTYSPCSRLPRMGMWYNTQRSGQGVDVQFSGSHMFVIWYTYREDGSPVWYLAAGEYEADQVWNAELKQIHWDFDSQQTSEEIVGSLSFDISDAEHGQFSWVLDGKSGSEAFQYLILNRDQTNVEYTGHWYAPSNSGWGYTVNTQGEDEFDVVFYYDVNGEPVWAIGRKLPGDGINMELEVISGYCPDCEATELQSQIVGSLNRSIIDQTTGSLDLNIEASVQMPNWSQIYSWSKNNIPTKILSDPILSTASCQR